MKKLLLAVIFLILAAIIFFIFNFYFGIKSNESPVTHLPVLYKLGSVEPKNITNKYPYLESLQRVNAFELIYPFLNNNSNEKTLAIVKNYILDKETFVNIIDDARENGYITGGGFNQAMSINSRKVTEFTGNFTIVDEGVLAVSDDTSFNSSYSKLLLIFTYYKNSGKIIVSATLEEFPKE